MSLLKCLKYISAGLITIFCALAGAAVHAQAPAPEAGTNPNYIISTISIEQTADEFQLIIEGSAPPTYTMYELFDPLRVVLDVADASISHAAALPSSFPQGPVQNIKTMALADQVPAIARLEIYLGDDRAYTVERQDNNIVVSFAKSMTAPRQVTQSELSDAQPEVPKEAPLKAETTAPETTSPAATVLHDLIVDTENPSETRVYLKTDGLINDFQKAHLNKGSGRPDRMYIDIPGISLPGKMLQINVGTSLAKVRAAQRKNAVRVVFDSGLSELFTYEIENTAEGLLVKIQETSAATPIIAGLVKEKETLVADNGPQAQSPTQAAAAPNTAELITPKISSAQARKKPATPKPTAPAAEASTKKSAAKSSVDTFGFAGYEKQKITVDFFKIDLHNVFRLFGEISGQNIVVDEAVKGSLTLALNEVPWDFALDIILNLKDLQKEERFNTIVISPKSKQFEWPKTATDAIAVKADGSMEKVESISVKQRLETPKEVVEAKKLLRQAAVAEKNGQHEKALSLYEAAFTNWPENAQLANRIASLCLVQLGMNAKAAYYAKATLNLEPDNAGAALQAAIALANMKKVDSAKEYFDLAISGPAPSSEALISYASFAEEYQSYNGALALLAKHEEIYGDTLDSLVTKARIFDKAGNTAKAIEAYNAVLLSGYEVPEDLKRYIQGRIAAAN
ncbi:AMIN domain-containing protein [Thiovibrio sp. JS02]